MFIFNSVQTNDCLCYIAILEQPFCVQTDDYYEIKLLAVDSNT